MGWSRRGLERQRQELERLAGVPEESFGEQWEVLYDEDSVYNSLGEPQDGARFHVEADIEYVQPWPELTDTVRY